MDKKSKRHSSDTTDSAINRQTNRSSSETAAIDAASNSEGMDTTIQTITQLRAQVADKDKQILLLSEQLSGRESLRSQICKLIEEFRSNDDHGITVTSMSDEVPYEGENLV